MNKLLKVLKWVVYVLGFGLIAFGVLAAVITNNPTLFGGKFTDLVADGNAILAYITSGASGLLGTMAIYIPSWVNRKLDKGDKKYYDLAEKFITIKEQYDKLEKFYTSSINNLSQEFKNEINELRNDYQALLLELKENTKLVKEDLEIKLSNPLVKAKVDEIMGREVQENGEHTDE